MLIPPKKGQVTCLSLLSELAEASCQSPVTSKSIPNYFNAGVYYPYPCGRSRPPDCWWLDPKTPMNFGSPDLEYFRMPASAARSHTSRWKEDWEELELLVRLFLLPPSPDSYCCVGYRAKGPLAQSSKLEIRLTRGSTQVCSTPLPILHFHL